MLVILMKPVIVLLLIGFLLMPCTAELSHDSAQCLAESCDRPTVGLRNDSDQSEAKNEYYSKGLTLWSEAWPAVVKQRLESVGECESSEPVSKQCVHDVLRLANGISKTDFWALSMLDASGKVPSGLPLVLKQWLGKYDECIEISSIGSPTHKLDKDIVLGMYCSVRIKDAVHVEENIINDLLIAKSFYGICIPRTCNSTDALALFNLVVDGEVEAIGVDCSDNSALPLDTAAVTFIGVLCVVGALVILGTYLDYIVNHCNQKIETNGHAEHTTEDVKTQHQDNNSQLLNGVQPKDKQKSDAHRFDKPNSYAFQFLVAFSALANTKRVLDVQSKQAGRSIEAIDGVRTMSLLWVLMGHTFVFSFAYASNASRFITYMTKLSFQVVINGSLTVDTFYVLSGTLAAYPILQHIQAKGGLSKVNWPMVFIRRLLRLTPLYMVVVAVYMTLFKHFGSGPYWQKETDEYCANNWWTNFLYVSNVVNADKLCMLWTWYLSSDIQYFLLCPIFIGLLYKSTLLGGIVISGSIVASSVTTFAVTYFNHYPPSSPGFFQDVSKVAPWFFDVYVTPWCRISPYLIGIVLGYILFKCNCQMKIRRDLLVLGWCLAAACFLGVTFGLYDSARGNYLSNFGNALYSGVHRAVWGAAVAWTILVCATGNCDPLNWLLSLPMFRLFGRLSYAAYLCHGLVTLWYYQSLRETILYHASTLLYTFLGHFVLTTLLSFLLVILIEAPTMNLVRVFIGNR